METWGSAALHAQKSAMAEQAFLEALAHDPGSVRAALGLQVLCERQGRSEEAHRYTELAERCWRKADAHCLAAELALLRREALSTKDTKEHEKNCPEVPKGVVVSYPR
jgi:thioredoxin-like negative regulator of GroEL